MRQEDAGSVPLFHTCVSPQTPSRVLESPSTVTSSPPQSPAAQLQDRRMPDRTVSTPSLNPQAIHEKPPYSFPCLIGLALRQSEAGSMCVRDIYAYIVKHFPYYLTAKSGWKNSIRHNLSLNKYFTKVERKEGSSKSSLWKIAPLMHEQLDRDIKQCVSRFPSRSRRPREHEVGAPGSPLRRAASQPAVLTTRDTALYSEDFMRSTAPLFARHTPLGGLLPASISPVFPCSANAGGRTSVVRRLSMEPTGPCELLSDPGSMQSIDQFLLSSSCDAEPSGLFDGLLDGMWTP